MMAAVNLFDAAALDIFFEDAGSMGLSNRTHLQLAHEGIADPEDLKEFDEDPKIPVTGAAAVAVGRLREIHAYEVSAKSKMLLKGAMLILLSSVSLSSGKLLWSIRRRRMGHPQKISKNQAVHKWIDAFTLHLSQKVGVRNAPVGYVVCCCCGCHPSCLPSW